MGYRRRNKPPILLIEGEMKQSAQKRSTALILSVFFSYFSWIYTYNQNKRKFWTAFVLSLVFIPLTLIFIGFIGFFGLWLWALLDNINNPELI